MHSYHSHLKNQVGNHTNSLVLSSLKEGGIETGAEASESQGSQPAIHRAIRQPLSLQTEDVMTLQRLVGNQAVLRLLNKSATARPGLPIQRELIIDNPDGTKPPIRLNDIKYFDQLRPGTRVFATEVKDYVIYRGINRREWSTVYLEIEGQIKIYKVTDGKVFPYQPGEPNNVEMTLNRVVNGEALGGGSDYHCGVLFDFEVKWASTGSHTGNGIMVTETIVPLSATGWFKQSGSRKQEKHLTAAPGMGHIDMIGISAAKSAKQASASELPASDSDKDEGVSASAAMSGASEDFQYFEYIAADGSRQPIPNSGFLLSKRLDKGTLSISRKPQIGTIANLPTIRPGAGATISRDIVIKFED